MEWYSFAKANLADVAEDEPILALKEFRRRRAAQAQNVRTAICFDHAENLTMLT